jgi:hypothetical protein
MSKKQTKGANMIMTRLMSERDRLRVEVDRLKEGLRRLYNIDYDDVKFTPETFALAVLESGDLGDSHDDS